MTSPMPPAYCCSVAAFDGDTRHVLTCPEALARQPQSEVLFDLTPTEEGGPSL